MGRSNYNLEYQRAYNKANPWMKTYRNMQRRCNLPKTDRNYKHYYWVKNFLTPLRLRFIWERDDASKLKIPSIDRIDPKGHYTVENCRYIEWKQNSDQGRENRKQIVYGEFKLCKKCLKMKAIKNFRSKGINHLPHLKHTRCNKCLNEASEKFRRSLPKEVLRERYRKYAKKSYNLRQLAKDLS